MTHHSAPSPARAPDDPGRAAAQLRDVLGLVEEIAGRAAPAADDGALDRAARIGAAYAAAPPIAQRRFDALAGETAAWAAAGVEALLVLQDRQRPARAAAERLAEELARALARLGAIVS